MKLDPNLLYCASPDKVEPLCNDCKRNIDQVQFVGTMTFETDFKPFKVKNLKTKEVAYKCKGLI